MGSLENLEFSTGKLLNSKVYIVANGCHENRMDAASLSSYLRNEFNVQQVNTLPEADFVIVQGCSVTETHSDLERELEKKSRELMRKLLQEHLEARGAGECAQSVQNSDGVEMSRVRPHKRKLETIFGTVSVERAGYGREGSRSLHPLDAELNLPNSVPATLSAAG